MFRSPISAPSECTSAINSSRKSSSDGDSPAAFRLFVPGILSRNHHPPVPNTAMKAISTETRRREPITFTLVALCAFHSMHLHLRFGFQFGEQLLRHVG